ncbi:hypothetical protein [Bdellovibrio reynosensis]|uniref:Uncharacterized protein n=1 Tax=Bdellovibrio reynosensis TaxID=2835041 RepID=A0ABY4C8R1_9BACT|nr:hypothetical protein [Bdellovibrio reynosensis]UOF01263.1 hypothetical protein MNR06_16330 [Bdellovibrio reynosensis]
MEVVLASTDAQLHLFRNQLEELAGLLSCYGYNVIPYHHASLPEFQKLTVEQKAEVLRTLTAYAQTLKSEYLGKDFSNERFVVQFLFRIGLVPSDEVSETVSNEKYIQIFNREQFQVFRSLNCFDKCSFTLEQLTTRPWYDLWERESLFYYALYGLATTALKLIKFTKIRLDFPYHRVTEVNSRQKLSFDYKIKTLSALTRQGRLEAALTIEDWKC